MTEVKDAIATMYMVKSTEKIKEQEAVIEEKEAVVKRLKRRIFFAVLLLIASVAFNLAFLFSYVKGGNECRVIESRPELSQIEQFDQNSICLSMRAISAKKRLRSFG